MEDLILLLGLGLSKIESEREQTCKCCNNKMKHKNMFYYKDGEACYYRDELVTSIKNTPYLFQCFNLDDLIRDYGAPDDKLICENCCNKIYDEICKKAKKIQVTYNSIETYPSTYKKSFNISKEVEPYTFKFTTSASSKWGRLNELKFYAKWYGYDVIMNLAYEYYFDSFAHKRVSISGTMVKLLNKAPKKSTKKVEKDEAKMLELLTKLGQLRDSGVLTQEEFELKKSQILGL